MTAPCVCKCCQCGFDCINCLTCPVSYLATVSGMVGPCADVNHMTFYLYNPQIAIGNVEGSCNSWEGDSQWYSACSCDGQVINCSNGKFTFSFYGNCWQEGPQGGLKFFCYTSEPRDAINGCPPLGGYIMHPSDISGDSCGDCVDEGVTISLSNLPSIRAGNVALYTKKEGVLGVRPIIGKRCTNCSGKKRELKKIIL